MNLKAAQYVVLIVVLQVLPNLACNMDPLQMAPSAPSMYPPCANIWKTVS